MKTPTLNATTFRTVLAVGLVAIIAATVAIFTLGHGQLVQTAQETSELATKADASNVEQRNLERTKGELLDLKEAIDHASSIVAVSESYKYQDQIILEIGEMARKNGIVVESVTFDNPNAGPSAPAAPPATPAAGAEPVAGAAETAAGATATPAAPALKTRSATIALASPIDYDRLIPFIYLIEQNITKMRITRLNLSADQSSENRNAVQSDSMQIEVYLRS